MKSLTLFAIVALLLTGCASKEAYQAHGQYMQAAMQERPMFTLETHPGQTVTITGIKSMALYYPGHEPQPFRDTTAQAWAPVVGGIFSTAIPVLGMWATTYSLSKRMVQMAPLFGDGNTTVNQNAIGGEQDLRLASPDSTHNPLVVDPVVVQPQVVQQPAPVVVDPVIVDPVVVHPVQ